MSSRKDDSKLNQCFFQSHASGWFTGWLGGRRSYSGLMIKIFKQCSLYTLIWIVIYISWRGCRRQWDFYAEVSQEEEKLFELQQCTVLNFVTAQGKILFLQKAKHEIETPRHPANAHKSSSCRKTSESATYKICAKLFFSSTSCRSTSYIEGMCSKLIALFVFCNHVLLAKLVMMSSVPTTKFLGIICKIQQELKYQSVATLSTQKKYLRLENSK